MCNFYFDDSMTYCITDFICSLFYVHPCVSWFDAALTIFVAGGSATFGVIGTIPCEG